MYWYSIITSQYYMLCMMLKNSASCMTELINWQHSQHVYQKLSKCQQQFSLVLFIKATSLELCMVRPVSYSPLQGSLQRLLKNFFIQRLLFGHPNDSVTTMYGAVQNTKLHSVTKTISLKKYLLLPINNRKSTWRMHQSSLINITRTPVQCNIISNITVCVCVCVCACVRTCVHVCVCACQ